MGSIKDNFRKELKAFLNTVEKKDTDYRDMAIWFQQEKAYDLRNHKAEQKQKILRAGPHSEAWLNTLL